MIYNSGYLIAPRKSVDALYKCNCYVPPPFLASCSIDVQTVDMSFRRKKEMILLDPKVVLGKWAIASFLEALGRRKEVPTGVLLEVAS